MSINICAGFPSTAPSKYFHTMQYAWMLSQTNAFGSPLVHDNFFQGQLFLKCCYFPHLHITCISVSINLHLCTPMQTSQPLVEQNIVTFALLSWDLPWWSCDLLFTHLIIFLLTKTSKNSSHYYKFLPIDRIESLKLMVIFHMVIH